LLATGSSHNAFGARAADATTTGASNNAFGVSALSSNTTGSFNCAFGNSALATTATVNNGSAFGREALLLSTGADNTAFGAQAGDAVTTGAQNTFLGSGADASVATISNSAAIGFGASVGTSNAMVFGNASVTVIRPMSDNVCSLGIVANRWSDVRSVLINGADYFMANEWRMVESEVYKGYPQGWAIGYSERWPKQVSLWEERKKGFFVDEKPVFAVTEEFIEYKGRRITPAMLDKILGMIAA
jgi:hypothetical protein